VDGIPQFIVMTEDVQKKAKRVGVPIGDVELVMMTSAARRLSARRNIFRVR